MQTEAGSRDREARKIPMASKKKDLGARSKRNEKLERMAVGGREYPGDGGKIAGVDPFSSFKTVWKTLKKSQGVRILGKGGGRVARGDITKWHLG